MYGPSSHPDYVMPGGTDYREIRIKLPSSRPSIKNMSRAEYNAAVERADREGIQDFTHSAHHGDEPNVLLHLRVANHADADGKKGLLIDELQSDWHQQGSKSGYAIQMPESVKSKVLSLEKQLDDLETKNKEQKMFSNEWVNNVNQMDEIGKEIARIRKSYPTSGVPDAPFKSNWYQIGLKRAIKEAADTGMDRVYLTTGARQADRYDLSNSISSVEFHDAPGGKEGILLAFDKNGSQVMAEKIPVGDIDKYIGKDAAKKLVESEDKKLSGVDLKVGGEGMKQWYDKTYKNYLEKYAKQHGSKLGETRLVGTAVTRDKLSAEDVENMMSDPEFKKILDEEFVRISQKPPITGRVEPQGDGYFQVVWSDGTRMGGYSESGAINRLEFGKSRETEAWNAALKRSSGEPVYYIDITDAMRESAKKGQSYKDGGSVHPAVEKFAASLPHPAVTEFVAKLADGGGVWKTMVDGKYNTVPDVSDAERVIQGPAFAEGGGVWKQLVEGAGNA